jgi:hypothetical protein
MINELSTHSEDLTYTTRWAKNHYTSLPKDDGSLKTLKTRGAGGWLTMYSACLARARPSSNPSITKTTTKKPIKIVDHEA